MRFSGIKCDQYFTLVPKGEPESSAFEQTSSIQLPLEKSTIYVKCLPITEKRCTGEEKKLNAFNLKDNFMEYIEPDAFVMPIKIGGMFF